MERYEDILQPKMKVKGYMYPQMKKPVGMLVLFDPLHMCLCHVCMNKARKNISLFKVSAFSPCKVVHSVFFVS
jgi:hypothetical protein